MATPRIPPFKYCYRVTDGVTRSALSSGVVTANSMEEAAELAAKRLGLEKTIETDEDGRVTCRWTKDGKKRSVYVLHDPLP